MIGFLGVLAYHDFKLSIKSAINFFPSDNEDDQDNQDNQENQDNEDIHDNQVFQDNQENQVRLAHLWVDVLVILYVILLSYLILSYL